VLGGIRSFLITINYICFCYIPEGSGTLRHLTISTSTSESLISGKELKKTHKKLIKVLVNL
jgi:hypothetical protein